MGVRACYYCYKCKAKKKTQSYGSLDCMGQYSTIVFRHYCDDCAKTLGLLRKMSHDERIAQQVKRDLKIGWEGVH